PFYRDAGSGARRGKIHVPGLRLDLLDVSGAAFAGGGTAAIAAANVRGPSPGSFREILYQNGASAIAIAAAASSGAIQQSALLLKGGFTRHGVSGAALLPSVDRISVSIRFGQGLTERVEYSKARQTQVPLAESTLQRIQRS